MKMRVTALFASAALACATTALAQERFETPDAAAQALIAAASNHDSARLAAIIGPQSKAILTSGNPAQDRDEQSEFARLAQAKHAIEISPMNPSRAVLSIGAEDWPFPVPIRRTNGQWSFDASETPREMRARRIGANELDAIEVLHGYVDAQRKFASEDRDRDGMLEYAPRLMSSPGRHNGLYWKGAEQPLVPEGFAHAVWSGGVKGDAKPYHGYYFRVLTEQGPNASGGSHNYMLKNKMIGGFGLAAWPAEYGLTGIHAFIVNQDGVVYQKDAAPVGGQPLTQVTRFDPDPSWQRVE
jgi:hypothetical protein